MSAGQSSLRPERPDESLLREAGHRMASRCYQAPSSVVVWDVGLRIDRPRSSIFPLRASAGGRDLGTAFYKVMLPSTKGEPDRHLLRVDRARTGLGRAVELEDCLAQRLDGEPITFSRTLAVDPDTLTTVTLGVAGEPFGSVSRRLLTRSRLKQAIHWMELTGRAASLIEACSPVDVDDREDERTDLMERRLDRAEPWMPPETIDRLRRRVEDLYQEARASERALIYAHSDFSPTNLLVGDGIGVIDFEWAPRLRVFDLANLVFRLEYDTMLPQRAVAPLMNAALRGYGERDVVASPFWHFHRVSNLLKLVRDGPLPWFDWRSGRVGRALKELEMLAGTGLASSH